MLFLFNVSRDLQSNPTSLFASQTMLSMRFKKVSKTPRSFAAVVCLNLNRIPILSFIWYVNSGGCLPIQSMEDFKG